MEKDTYKTIAKPSPEALFKDRGSKFIGYAVPIRNEGEVKDCLEMLKKEHHSARHWCYAYQLGKNYERFRTNDDGEPSNSAGMPIYGQLQSFGLTDTLVVVVRYFGGTKLGVGGLINAYRTAAQMALEGSEIIEKTIDMHFILDFDYPEMNTVMRIIKEHQIDIVAQKMDLRCNIEIKIRKKDSLRVFELFEATYKVSIKELEN